MRERAQGSHMTPDEWFLIKEIQRKERNASPCGRFCNLIKSMFQILEKKDSHLL